jgi:hypothetical protein
VRGVDAKVGGIAQRFSSLIVQDGKEDHVLRLGLRFETCGEGFLVRKGAVEQVVPNELAAFTMRAGVEVFGVGLGIERHQRNGASAEGDPLRFLSRRRIHTRPYNHEAH